MKPQTLFYTGGALPPDYSHYVLRQADQTANRAVQRGKLIYTIAPRQMGKTSLLKRLAEGLEGQGWCCCFIDLATLKNMERPSWFRRLGEIIARAVRMGMILSPLENQQDFRTFLLDEVGLGRSFSPIKVALFFDEVEGLLGLDFSDEFLMMLRDIYQQRDSYPGQLLIAFAGSVDPETLIQDSTISPFNIAEEIVLDDFTAEESLTLTSNLTKIRERISIDEAVHSHIYGWAAGQPYLTQRICEIIADSVQTEKITCVSTDTVDDVVRTGLLGPRRLDKNVKHVLGEVAGLKSLAAELWKRLLAGEPVYSTETGFCALYLSGAVAEVPDGRVGIRNRIYKQALTSSGAPSSPKSAASPQPPDQFHYDAFISYSHEDSAWVRGTLLPRLEREGLRVCVDYRDFEVGVPSLVNMENAVEYSRKTLLVLTPNWVASEWTEFEALLIQTRDPVGRGRRILPLMVQRCELPARLAVFTYLDLTNPAEFDFQMRRLVAAIRSVLQPAVPVEAVPARKPEPPARPSARGFSYECGLAAMKEHLAQADAETRLSLSVLESRLLDNLQGERLYGSSETIRSERARVLHELNRLALTHLGRSFNDLCRASEETHAVIQPESESAQPLPASQPVSSKAADLRLLVANPSGEQSASRLEFSIPPADSSRRPASAWQVAFRLYLDNQRPTMARYVIVEMCMTSNTDSFWIYRYNGDPFLIEEGPRLWQITPSDTHIHCYFEGGADFVCHDQVRQNLGLVKMLVPYNQADTTLTFQYRLLAEGWKSQGSFVIALRPGR